jgi:hypothetical protein
MLRERLVDVKNKLRKKDPTSQIETPPKEGLTEKGTLALSAEIETIFKNLIAKQADGTLAKEITIKEGVSGTTIRKELETGNRDSEPHFVEVSISRDEDTKDIVTLAWHRQTFIREVTGGLSKVEKEQAVRVSLVSPQPSEASQPNKFPRSLLRKKEVLPPRTNTVRAYETRKLTDMSGLHTNATSIEETPMTSDQSATNLLKDILRHFV